jgi:hypothetical protein
MRLYSLFLSILVIHIHHQIAFSKFDDDVCNDINEKCALPNDTENSDVKKSVTIRFSDGSSYIGDLKGGKYHGFGKLKLLNGDIFEGGLGCIVSMCEI